MNYYFTKNNNLKMDVETVNQAIREHKRVKSLIDKCSKDRANCLFTMIVKEIETNNLVQHYLLETIVNSGAKNILVATYTPFEGFMMPSINYNQPHHETMQYIHKHLDEYVVDIKHGPFANWYLSVKSMQINNTLLLSVNLDKAAKCNIL